MVSLNGRLRLGWLCPAHPFGLRLHHLVQRGPVLVMQCCDVHPGQLLDQHLGEL